MIFHEAFLFLPSSRACPIRCQRSHASYILMLLSSRTRQAAPPPASVKKEHTYMKMPRRPRKSMMILLLLLLSAACAPRLRAYAQRAARRLRYDIRRDRGQRHCRRAAAASSFTHLCFFAPFSLPPSPRHDDFYAARRASSKYQAADMLHKGVPPHATRRFCAEAAAGRRVSDIIIIMSRRHRTPSPPFFTPPFFFHSRRPGPTPFIHAA